MNSRDPHASVVINRLLAISPSFSETTLGARHAIGLPMRKDMPAPKLNKHALRTKETRERLLRSAEVVFVRDGYESADLAEIAKMAGRTRGAIYAQFKSKEDVFLALIKQKTQGYRTRMEKLLAGSTNTEQNLKAYRQFCIGMIEDPVWGLLLLEFKLFAMRHPESKERVQKYFEEIFSEDQEKKLGDLLGEPGRGNDALSRSIAVRFVQPLLSAIAIEASFSPTAVDKETLKKVATRTFDALMHISSK